MSAYRVFRRRCWKKVTGQWIPFHGRKYTKATGQTLEQARAMCAEHNPPPGKRSPGNPTHYYEFEQE